MDKDLSKQLGELVARWQGGDNSAFDELWKVFSARAGRLARQQCERLQLPEDQAEVLLNSCLLMAANTYRPEKASFQTWYFAVLRNKSISANMARYYEKRDIRQECHIDATIEDTDGEIGTWHDVLDSEVATPFEVLAAREDAQELRARAEQLPGMLKAVWCDWIDHPDGSYYEAGRRLGIPAKSVDNGRQRIKACFNARSRSGVEWHRLPELVAQGLTDAQIGEALGVAETTASRRRVSVMRRPSRHYDWSQLPAMLATGMRPEEIADQMGRGRITTKRAIERLRVKHRSLVSAS